jgi:hypothetical protein
VRPLDDALVVLLVSLTGISAISAAVVSTSINEGDSASAWMWVAVFLVASLIDAWAFGRLV